MKPFTLSNAGNPGGYFAQHEKREAPAAYRRQAFTHVEQCSALARRQRYESLSLGRPGT
jgi:hypothetical protein